METRETSSTIGSSLPAWTRLQIRLKIDGAEKLEIDKTGALVAVLAGEQVIQHKPLVYQTGAGPEREIVDGPMEAAGGPYGGFRGGRV